MSLPQIYSLAQLQQIIASAYGASVGTAADIGTGSQFGPSFNAVALAIGMIQNEAVYVDSIARLSTMQDPLQNGTPNPDVDTFINAFGVQRLGPGSSSGYCTCTIPSPAGTNGFLIAVGDLAAPTGGPNFIVTAGGSGYNATAGGYVIPSGQTSVSAFYVSTVGGTAGNVAANTITNVILPPNSPPAGYTVTNPLAFTNGVGTEVGQPLKTRFALFISGGGEGTPNSVIAAALGVQSGLSVSYGDQVMGVHGGGGWTFTPSTPSWFSLVVAIYQNGMWVPAPTGLVGPAGTIFQALLYAIKPAGISFAVAPPTTLTVTGAGTVNVLSGFDPTSVLAAVGNAFTAFVGNIGLNQLGGTTICSISQVTVALQQVPGVAYIDGLLLNGVGNDVTAAFGQLLTPGTTSFVAA